MGGTLRPLNVVYPSSSTASSFNRDVKPFPEGISSSPITHVDKSATTAQVSSADRIALEGWVEGWISNRRIREKTPNRVGRRDQSGYVAGIEVVVREVMAGSDGTNSHGRSIVCWELF